MSPDTSTTTRSPPGARAPVRQPRRSRARRPRSGMWVFLVTEVLFFGGLFATYLGVPALVPGRVRRRQPRARRLGRHDQHRRPDHQQPDDGAGGARGADRPAPPADGVARRRRWLLGVRVPRHQGVRVLHRSSSSTTSRAPASSSRPSTLDSHAQLFFSLYFVMTGLHAAAHDHRPRHHAR